MYRTLVFIVLHAISVAAAPQDGVNSDITYVKFRPITDGHSEPKLQYRESRIENIPLTIPGKVSNVTVTSSNERDSGERNGNVTGNSGNTAQNGDNAVEDGGNIQENDSINASKVPDNPRRARSEDTTSSYESETVEPTEIITESLEDLIQQTEEYETRTRAPSPRFLSKLSYFQKDQEVRSSIATNLLERVGKRKYKTKCRCEKIWNCPKLQITVPRCPNEYFLCC